ncbi:aminoglycoside phosphotransferase [Pseudomonas sp. Root68]|uniref:aminoglycoside phosphotransferase family protein n=1 Tax=unclassified Pseudomonas TaxID=196821 RepID=UPI0006F69118|nr:MULTISPECIES: phosphotransferase [unclassified Pseudomonas]KRA87363.1 aminoglycoside phosphotransferase [Pseudomonas sp. Root68]KRB69353.1 aminoglycoside phosphotransferase [Pseudomonas sp. Root71]
MTDALASLPTREDLRAAFLARAGHAGTLLVALPADASTRRYFRLEGAGLLLMDSPPDSEPIGPFVRIARQLQGLGLSAPALLEVDEAAGLALIEDFGHDTYTRLLLAGHSESQLYHLAVDTLVALHRAAPATELAPYDGQRLADEYALFIDWYVPLLIGKDAAQDLRDEYLALFADTCRDVAKRREALVLRDFHVDNLMLLQGREGVAACGLLDFQDALVGAAAYDLMSLLEDARRDVPEALREALISHYLLQRPELDAPGFLEDYRCLAAQRHAKVLGIFVRLAGRDGKHGYLAHLPRTLGLFVRALDAEAFAPLRQWLDRHVPDWREELPAATLATLRETPYRLVQGSSHGRVQH